MNFSKAVLAEFLGCCDMFVVYVTVWEGKRTTLEIKIEDEDGDKIRMDEEEKGVGKSVCKNGEIKKEDQRGYLSR